MVFSRNEFTAVRVPVAGSVCARLFVALVLAIVVTGCAPHLEAMQVRVTNSVLDMETYRARAPAIDRPLTLEDALDYAARYNIEAWIAAEESEFQHELATQSRFKMLPSLMVGAGSQRRSRFDASSSQSLEKRKESLEPSFSSEKRGGTFDVSLTWNLLDFGISFLRARQQDNRVSIALERERRVKQNLALYVVSTYWRVAAARESAGEAEQISAEVSAMLANIRKEIEDKAISEIDGLKQETVLLERQDELRRFKRDYLMAKTELAKLIGLAPGTPFALVEVDFENAIEPLRYEVEALEWEALHNRPELFEKDMEQAISHDEARVALAQMFPSPALFLQLNYDSNRFLVYDNWITVGVRASWNLLAIPQQIKQRDAVELQSVLVAARRMAIAVAILTQLHLSLIEYEEGLEQCEFSRTIAQKHRRLLEAVVSQVDEGKSHGGERIAQGMKSLKARAKYLATYANVMSSNARLLNTVGRGPLIQRDDVTDEETAAQSQVTTESVTNVDESD